MFSRASIVSAVGAGSFALAGTLFASSAEAQIREPGAHPDYTVELEPHLIWQYGATEDWESDAWGLGLRASIPLMRNGPVPRINNNLAIGFGLDWTHSGDNCHNGYVVVAGVRGYAGDCAGNHVLIPIVAQWNFFFTPVVGAFAEMGFGIHHWSEKFNCLQGVPCSYTDSGTEPIPLFAVGPRFLLSDFFAITIRVGYPYMTLGASFLL
jgi:hypothetical protein